MQLDHPVQWFGDGVNQKCTTHALRHPASLFQRAFDGGKNFTTWFKQPQARQGTIFHLIQGERASWRQTGPEGNTSRASEGRSCFPAVFAATVTSFLLTDQGQSVRPSSVHLDGGNGPCCEKEGEGRGRCGDGWMDGRWPSVRFEGRRGRAQVLWKLWHWQTEIGSKHAIFEDRRGQVGRGSIRNGDWIDISVGLSSFSFAQMDAQAQQWVKLSQTMWVVQFSRRDTQWPCCK